MSGQSDYNLYYNLYILESSIKFCVYKGQEQDRGIMGIYYIDVKEETERLKLVDGYKVCKL